MHGSSLQPPFRRVMLVHVHTQMHTKMRKLESQMVDLDVLGPKTLDQQAQARIAEVEYKNLVLKVT